MSRLLSGVIAPKRSAPNRWLVLVLVCLAQLMVAIDLTIVNVALPTIRTDLGFAPSSLAWVVNAYMVVFGGFLLLGGRAADLLGRRLIFVVGLGVFTLASVLCAVATSPGELISFRAVQGLGAALVAPAVVSIIMTTFTDAGERTKAMAVWGGTSAFASGVGVVLGGVLTQSLSWPWIFWVNVPIGAAAIVLALRFVPESKAPDASRRFDLLGAVLVTAGLLGIVYAIVKATDDGWGSGPTVGFGLGGLALLAVFVVVERLKADPLVDLSLFRSRTVSVANVGVVLLMGANAAFFFTMTIYLQQVLGYSPLRTGFAFLPLSAGMLVGATLAGKFIGKIGLRPQAIVGLMFGTAAFLLLTQLTTGGNVYFSHILAPFLLNSIGVGMALVPLTILATENVGPRLAGLASGVFNTSMQAGGALGLAILSTLAATWTASRARQDGSTLTHQRELAAAVSGYHLLFLVGSCFFVAAALLLAFAVRRRDLRAMASEAPMSDVIARAESEGVEAVGF